MRTGTSAIARCKAWLWAALVVASATATLARPVHDAAGAGESAVETRVAWVGARRGRVPLQTKLATPSYFTGSGRVKALKPINTTAAADISSKFKSCFEDFEIEYTTGASRVVVISKLNFRSFRTVTYTDQYVSGVDGNGNNKTVYKMVTVRCRDGYQLIGKYSKPVLSDLQLPPAAAWQCQAGLPRPFDATPVQWTGTQPQCASFDGFRCSKPALCSTHIADIKKRKVVTPLACGAHHLSVWGLDGYNRPDTWCSVARMLTAPSPGRRPLAGSWQCLDGLPGPFKNTPIRWVGFQPQCDSLDGKICNKPATRAACKARVKELEAAVTPLTCGPYHQSVWHIDGYEKSDSWCSVARKLLAPKEAEVLPVRATWDLKSHNRGKYAEVTLWLVRTRTASGLQGFFASLANPPLAVPSSGLLPLQVTSGSVLGYGTPLPPSYYSGQGRIQATTSFRTFWEFGLCLDDLQFTYTANGYGDLTVSSFSTVSKQILELTDSCIEGSADTEPIFVNRPYTLPCSYMGLASDINYKPKISTYNSSIEVLPLRVRLWVFSCEAPGHLVCQQLVLWLVREKGSTQLQAFTANDQADNGWEGCNTEPVNPPAVIPRQSLHRMKVISGSIFGFKP